MEAEDSITDPMESESCVPIKNNGPENSMNVGAKLIEVGSFSMARSRWMDNQDQFWIDDSDEVILTYVFDGHGGDEVSLSLLALAQNPNPLMNRFLQLKQLVLPKTDSGLYLTDEEAQMVANRVFAEVDALFVHHYNVGSTAVIGVHHKSSGKIRFVHVGDSRAVWRIHQASNYEDGQTNDHKAGRLDEVRRIEGLGGRIIKLGGTTRVNGVLAISRAFGDYSLKPFVSAVPELSALIELKTGDYYIVGSDGIWDVKPSHLILDALIVNPELTLQDHACTMVQICGVASHDDTTVIIVRLL